MRKNEKGEEENEKYKGKKDWKIADDWGGRWNRSGIFENWTIHLAQLGEREVNVSVHDECEQVQNVRKFRK